MMAGLVTVWRRPALAMAAGLPGVPLVLIDPLTLSNLWLPGPFMGEGTLLALTLGTLSVALSLLVVAIRTARAGASPATGATA